MVSFLEPYLVIGSRGMLGTDLMGLLEEQGIKAVGCDIEELDITSPDSVRQGLSLHKPGVILNVAAYTDVDGAESNAEAVFRVNAQGPGHLAAAASEIGAALVHISTDYVFDGAGTSPYCEDDPINPVGVYACSKAEGETRVRSALPHNHCIVRTQWLFGLHGRNFVEAILGAAETKDLLNVVNDQHGSPTYTADLATALIRLCRIGYVGTVHVTNAGSTTWYGFAKAILEKAGLSRVRVNPITTQELNRPARRPLYSVLDNSRFVEVAGSPLRPWEKALDEYMDLRARGFAR